MQPGGRVKPLFRLEITYPSGRTEVRAKPDGKEEGALLRKLEALGATVRTVAVRGRG